MFRKPNKEKYLDEELRDHLERRTSDWIAKGFTPREASKKAESEFGGLEQIKEECRDERKTHFLEVILQDLGFSARLLRRSPEFTVVAVATLALGIGANTSIFSVVNALLLRPLPFEDSDHLVRIWGTDSQGSTQDVSAYPEFVDWRTQSRSFASMAAYVQRSFNLSGVGRPERIEVLRASASLLPLLHISPIAGREFVAEEEQPGKDHVGLISERLWESRFGRDPNLLGKTVRLNEEGVTVIGILPASFEYPPGSPAVMLVPLTPDPNRGHGFLDVVARLQPGATITAAQTEMSTIARRLEREYSQAKGRGASVVDLHDSFVQSDRLVLLIFLSAVGFVMLIACANVANLFGARTAARQKEFTVRATIGASRARLVAQILTESLLVGLGGGALGLLLAFGGVAGLVVLVQRNFPALPIDQIHIDGSVLAFTLAMSLVTGLVFGLAPAVSASRPDLNESLKEGSRSVTGNRRHSLLRSALVVGELALALVLLVCAGLTIRSLMLLEGVSSGIHTEKILAMDFSLHGSKYSKTAPRAAFFGEVLTRVESMQGVQSAAVVSDIPLTDNTDILEFSMEAEPDPGSNRKRSSNFNVVGPGYFRTLQVPVLKGRDFNGHDSETARPVAMINQAMAARFWPRQDPVGKRISTHGQLWLSIIGVVGDVRQGGPKASPEPEVYLTYLQDPVLWPYLSLLVRTNSDPMKLASSVESVVWSVDKDQPVANIRTMEQILSRSMAQPRVSALLLSIFAGMALGIAAIGIYGVVAYSVTQRSHEMGVRTALGASRRDILSLVIGQGMGYVLVGVAAGLAASLALSRLLSSLLFGIRSTDPLTYLAVSIALSSVALLAMYFPARRASRVDPLVALRWE